VTELRTSEFLVNLIDKPNEKSNLDISIGTLISSMGGKAYGLIFLLFGLPNILPLPGLPILCGFILFIFGVQLFIRAPSPWMPRTISDRGISKQKLALIINKVFPFIVKLEAISRPRFSLLASDEILRIIGLIVSILAISLIIIPIPWVGSMPQGFAIAILGIGMVERDGLIITIGLIFAGIASLAITAIGFALIKSYGLLF
jgi:hypothetical protein